MKTNTIIMFMTFIAIIAVKSQTLVKLKLPDNCNVQKVTTTVQSSEADKLSALELYPNPNQGVFNLCINFAKKIDKARVAVYDTNGNVVYSEIVFSDTNILIKKIRINKLHTGTYLVEVKNDKQSLTAKLVIK